MFITSCLTSVPSSGCYETKEHLVKASYYDRRIRTTNNVMKWTDNDGLTDSDFEAFDHDELTDLNWQGTI